MGARRALIVATDTYQDRDLGRLRSPAVDADALQRVLGDPEVGGFDVDVLSNPGVQELRTRLNEFFVDARVEDTLLLHFACHGIRDTRSPRLYLAARDTDQRRLPATALPAEYVRELIQLSDSRQIILFLDCCFSGTFLTGTRSDLAIDIRGQLSRDRGQAVLTASTSLEYAWEGERWRPTGDEQAVGPEPAPGPSIFVSAVVDGIESGELPATSEHWIPVAELFSYVRRYCEARGSRQQPQGFTSLDDIYIARTPPASRGRSRLLTARRDYRRLAKVLELSAGSEVFALAIGDRDRRLAAASEGMVLLWTGDDPVGSWRQEPAVDRLTDPHGTYVYAVAFSPDGRRLARAGQDGIVWVTDLATGTTMRMSKHHGDAVYSLDFSLDGSRLASGGYDRQVMIFDPSTGKREKRLDFQHEVSCVRFYPSRRGTVIAVGSLDNTVTLWNLETETDPPPLYSHLSSVEQVAFSPDGRYLVSCGLDKAVRLWNLEMREEAWARFEHRYLVRSVAFSPDGHTVASGGWDKSVKVWQVATGGSTDLPEEHEDWIWSVAFASNGTALVTGGSDKRIVIWSFGES